MPINTNDIISACNVIAGQRHLNVCITESLKGAGVAGFSALVCGILLGPLGIAVGGTAGGLLGMKLSKHYVPLVQILREMSEEDKARLGTHMFRVIQELDISDAIMLASIATTPQSQAYGTLVRGMATYFGQTWTA